VTIATIPDSVWVVITASGQLILRRNPDCDLLTGFWTCPAKIITPDFEAAPSPVGPLHLWVQSGSTTSTVNLRGSGGAGATAGSAIGLVHQTTAGTLHGEMSILQAESFDPNGDAGTASWLLSGGYNVTAVAVPNPVALTESEPDSTGTRTYTVTPLYGLVFMNPTGDSRPAGAINWYFIPGDSVSSTPGWSEYNEWIQECQYQTTCRFRPSGPGKVQVNASVERQGVTVRAGGAPPPQCQTGGGPLVSAAVRSLISGSACQQEPKLVLRCDGRTDADTVQRGDRMECAASVSPSSATLTGFAWEFSDEQGHTLNGPAGEATWGGVMAVGGQMRVSATVNSTPQENTVAVTVRGRTWPRISVTVRQGGHGTLPPVTALTSVGQLMQTRFDSIAPSTLPLTTIADGGPNAGWAYLSQPVRTLPLVVDVSDAWNHGSPWYNLQHTGPTGQIDMNGNPIHYCAKHELPQVYQAGLEHEGIRTGTIVSHVQVFRQWFRSNPVQDSVEKAVVFVPDLGGYDPARSIINGDIARVESAAIADPNQRHTDVIPPGQVQLALFPCQVRF
jgi:hypothetical protein